MSEIKASAEPENFDIWVVEERLGGGGMGTVYRCRNRHAPKIKAAIKVLAGHLSASTMARRRFIHEAELLFGLDHPNIVKVRNIRMDAQPPFIEMAFVEGEALLSILQRGPLPPPEAASIVAQVAEALAHCHASDVRHRDVKPANILVKDGKATLVDFGLAVDADGTISGNQGPSRLGTLPYTPPEWGGTKVDPTAWDAYALGLILFESLTGRMAFPPPPDAPLTELIVQQVTAKQRTPHLDPGEPVPHALRTICRRLTDRAPEDRLVDVAEAARALRTWLASVASGAASPPPGGVGTHFMATIDMDSETADAMVPPAPSKPEATPAVPTANIEPEAAPASPAPSMASDTFYDVFDEQGSGTEPERPASEAPPTTATLVPESIHALEDPPPPKPAPAPTGPSRTVPDAPPSVAPPPSAAGGPSKGMLAIGMLAAIAAGGAAMWMIQTPAEPVPVPATKPTPAASEEPAPVPPPPTGPVPVQLTLPELEPDIPYTLRLDDQTVDPRRSPTELAPGAYTMVVELGDCSSGPSAPSCLRRETPLVVPAGEPLVRGEWAFPKVVPISVQLSPPAADGTWVQVDDEEAMPIASLSTLAPGPHRLTLFSARPEDCPESTCRRASSDVDVPLQGSDGAFLIALALPAPKPTARPAPPPTGTAGSDEAPKQAPPPLKFVTNGELAAWLRANDRFCPADYQYSLEETQKEQYLQSWNGQCTPSSSRTGRPVTSVTHKVATAYCKSRGGLVNPTELEAKSITSTCPSVYVTTNGTPATQFVGSSDAPNETRPDIVSRLTCIVCAH